jgi:hypothetical protein
MAFDREAAKAEGYSDDEINAYLQSQSKTETPAVVDVGEPPAPTTVITPVETSATNRATNVGLAAAPYVAPAAVGIIGGAAATKAYGAWKAGTEAAQALAQSQAAQAAADRAASQGLQQRFDARLAQQAGRPMGPVAPQVNYNVPTSNVPQMRAPMGPVAPAAMPSAPMAAPAPVAQPSILSRAGDIAGQMRQFAAQRVMPVANSMAKGGVLGAMATYSPELGPKTPQAGRMRGMEINPLTGAPWTAEQIAQYERNPNVFDAQMAPPQMRR